MNVGFVGVGGMGTSMIERLVVSGYPVTFYARRPEAVAAVEALGATSTETLGGIAVESDVVVICAYNDEQVRDICLGSKGLLAAMTSKNILVNHTTGSPETAQYLAHEGDPRGVRVLDCPVSGGPADIAEGRLALLVGGDPAVLEQARPMLATYGNPILHVGDHGDGQRVKLLNNIMFAANITLAVEAERIAVSLGLDAAVAVSAMTHCSGNTDVLGLVARLGSSGRLLDAVERYLRKDVAQVIEVASQEDINLGLLATAALYEGESL